MGIQTKRGSWVLDCDVQGFFDNLSHEWLAKFRKHRGADPRMLRLIQKWLRAGVSEDGQWSETKVGTPQGSVFSPLLANVYLHYVCDLWVEAWRKKVAQGDVIVVRYGFSGIPSSRASRRRSSGQPPLDRRKHWNSSASGREIRSCGCGHSPK